MKTIRILQCGLTESYGGMEAFILEVYRNLDRTKIQFDFLITHNGKIACEEEIKSLGGRIFRIEYSRKENFVKHYKELENFFKIHASEFCAVHMNSCFPKYSLPLKYAKKYGIKTRIFHSHNSGDMYASNSKIKTFFKNIEYKIERYFIKKRANVKLACSNEAGRYVFGKSDFKVINNGIDINKFKFDCKLREKVRNELKFKYDDKVVGFVGRLQYQKNPLFALKVFNELQKQDSKYKMIIIGVGNLKEKMEKYIQENKIEGVFFLGQRKDVNELYQAMDYFLFPSVFEGLGIALIEAETSGVRCFASTAVPELTNITDNVRFLELEKGEKEWARIISNTDIVSRNDSYKNVKKNKFDIRDTVGELVGVYNK